jgi:hypothetical protein
MCTPLYKCQHFHSLANICCPACKFISDIPAIIFALFHSWYVSFFRILCHVSEYSWLKCWLLKYRRKKRICKRAESNTRKYLYTCIIVEHLECTRQSRFWQAWTRELGRGWITLSAWVQAVEDFAAGVGGGVQFLCLLVVFPLFPFPTQKFHHDHVSLFHRLTCSLIPCGFVPIAKYSLFPHCFLCTQTSGPFPL